MEATGSAAEKSAVWEDFIDIFYAPSAVFARRANSSAWVPLIVVTVLVGGLLYVLNSSVLQPVIDAEFTRGMAAAMRQNPRITPEMMATVRELGMRVGLLAGFVLVPIGVFMTGTALWLIGKLFEAKEAYRTALVIAAYAWVPRILETLLNGAQAFLLDPAQLNGRYRVSLGVGRFFDPDIASPVLLGFVGRIDVFTIWITVLLAIGLSVTGGISRSRAAMAAALVWVAGALPVLFQALRG